MLNNNKSAIVSKFKNFHELDMAWVGPFLGTSVHGVPVEAAAHASSSGAATRAKKIYFIHKVLNEVYL